MHDYFDAPFIYGDERHIQDEYMDERWWYIDGIPGYMISDYGRVWSIKTQSFLKVKSMDAHGHLGVCLYYNGKRYYAYIHRLMAKAFIPNPYNFPVVRHLDDDPSYNHISNLAFGTQRDNMQDAIENGRAYFLTDEDRERSFEKSRIPVEATNTNTGKKIIFRSQSDAARSLGLKQSNVWKVLNGQRSHTCGYNFRYLKRNGDRE